MLADDLGAISVSALEYPRVTGQCGVADSPAAGSWRRSTGAAQRGHRGGDRRSNQVRLAPVVARAGRPVLDGCAGDLDGAPVGIVLSAVTATDHGRVVGLAVIDRVEGTVTHQHDLDTIGLVAGSEWEPDQARSNAIGAFRHAQTVGINAGANDQCEGLGVACAVATIMDPRRAAPVGTVGVTCSIPEATRFMLPYAQLIARAITQRLFDGAAVADRTLLEYFVRARRRSRGPIIAINERDMLTNAAAVRLVHDDDQPKIWNWTTSRLRTGDGSLNTLRLGTRSVAVRCEAIVVGGETVGALLHLAEVVGPLQVVRDERARSSGEKTLGWDSLRTSELGIAALVADGLTNREIGARLFMSRHTVGYALRQIFRKLSIGSRIELARLVAEQAALGDQPNSPFDVVA
jgi:DNA-binding CsgD family transcriptional regulator